MVLAARRPFDVFGAVVSAADLRREYRRWARVIHPDHCKEPDAGVAFARLSELHRLAMKQIGDHRYGAPEPVKIQTKRRRYQLDPDPIFSGSTAAYYSGYAEDTGARSVLVKVAREPSANLLLKNETRALLEVLSHKECVNGIGGTNAMYFPDHLEAFSIKSGGKVREAIAFARGPNLYSLQAVLERYPQGVDPKDMAWMMRRLLYALGVVANTGRVHGAILPEHVLIQPEQRGLVLIDWKHSVQIGEKITSIPQGSRARYPSEVHAKEPVTAATDIWMAVACMRDLITAPIAPLRAFIGGCLLEPARRRPQHPWALLAEFDELLERLWGRRTYRPFVMSPESTH